MTDTQCFTDGYRYFFCKDVASLLLQLSFGLHTYCRRLLPNISNLDSSVHKIDRQNSIGLLIYFCANSNLFFAFAGEIIGFFLITRQKRLISHNLARIPDSSVSRYSVSCMLRAVVVGFFFASLKIRRSWVTVVFRFLPLLGISS